MNVRSLVNTRALERRYFDTLKEIGAHSKGSTLFLPHSPAGLGDMTTQIRNAMLQGHAAAGNIS